MSNNTFIFLRHAETKVDSNIKISHWILTKKGKNDAFNISKLKLFDDVDIIISSNEDKAYQTAYPLSEKLHKEIIRDENLNEIISCPLYTSPSPRDATLSRMPSSA